jgi:hypothetical protein
MLERVIPDDAPDYYTGESASYASASPHDYIEDKIDPEVRTGSFQFVPGSYYKPVGRSVNRPAMIAGKTVVDSIKWGQLDFPCNPQYERTPNHDPDDRPYIKLYGRIRGVLAHSLILNDGIDFNDAIQRAIKDIDNISSDMSYQDLYEVVSKWEGAPRVKPADQEYLYDVPRSALKKRLKDESLTIADNWDDIQAELQLKRLAEEFVMIGETRDGHKYGCKVDQLSYIDTTESLLQTGLFVGEIKIGERWHPSHLAQTEAYRRSFFADFDVEPKGVVIRIGPQRGDYTVLTSDDDVWDTEILWERIEQKTRWIYENEASPYPTALEHADPR